MKKIKIEIEVVNEFDDKNEEKEAYSIEEIFHWLLLRANNGLMPGKYIFICKTNGIAKA